MQFLLKKILEDRHSHKRFVVPLARQILSLLAGTAIPYLPAYETSKNVFVSLTGQRAVTSGHCFQRERQREVMLGWVRLG